MAGLGAGDRGGRWLCGLGRSGAVTNFVSPKCDLKAGHYLVTSGILYLGKAADTKFPDQREKDLRDANRVLGQALGTAGQEKNPAAWYYLGRYHVEMKDVAGVDTAFTKAAALAPDVRTGHQSVAPQVVGADRQRRHCRLAGRQHRFGEPRAFDVPTRRTQVSRTRLRTSPPCSAAPTSPTLR